MKSRDAQIIDAYTSRDIPVILNRPVVTPCMLLEPISSLTRAKPGLEVPLAVVSSQTTTCRITNDTECPIYISENCVVAIARNIALSNLTEMVDFWTKEMKIPSMILLCSKVLIIFHMMTRLMYELTMIRILTI